MNLQTTPNPLSVRPRRNGLLLVDKPAGWTSHDVVAFTRKSLGMKEVGHCGTLDPAATGLLVLLLGEATKLSQYLLEQDKTYQLTLELGITTSTQDLDGEILTRMPVDLTRETIMAAVEAMMGDLELSVPSYSAVKVAGERLYEKARRGEEVVTPVRRMQFYDLRDVKFLPENQLSLTLSCSKGSYVRSWVKELGDRLGVGGTLTQLRRLASNPFEIEDAIRCEEIPEMAAKPEIDRGFVPMGEALRHWRAVRASMGDARLMGHGQISHSLKAQLLRIFDPSQDQGVRVLDQSDRLLALIGVEPGRGFVIRRVFRY